MDVPLWEVLAIVAGLCASFFFSGTETALTSLTEAKTRQLIEESGNPRHPLRIWLTDPERVLSALLFGNTLANIGLGSLTTDVAMVLGLPYAAAIATGGTTFVVLTFCEVTPKTLAKRSAARFAMAVAPAVVALYWVLWPVTTLLSGMSAGLMRAFGAKSNAGPSVTGAEIEYLIDLGSREGVLDEVKKDLLNSVLEFADQLTREIMVPRTRVVGIERSSTYDEALRVIGESEHSRIPIYDGDLDNIVGILYVKDLARDQQKGLTAQSFKLDKYLRPPFIVPEIMKISRLLREFQKRKTHMAVVVDEFGGTSGVVTLEDVVEQIVGEIQDEYDVEEKPVKALPDGRFLAEGSASLREVEEALSVELPRDGDYETLGGFLSSVAGRLPPTGCVVPWKALRFTIRSADDRHVAKVEISRLEPAAAEGEASGAPPQGAADPGGA